MHTTAAEPSLKNQNPKPKNPPQPDSPRHPLTLSPCHLHFPLLTPASLTLLLGEPGTGKSLLAIDLAARLSRADNSLPFPILPTDCLSPPIENKKSKIENPLPSSSILFSMEDSQSTLRDRLTAANADPERVAISSSVLPLDPAELLHPQARRGPKPNPLAPLLRQLVHQLHQLQNPRLLILDPLPAFLGTADSSSASLIRTLLRPLLLLAEHHGLAVLGISHLNKSTCKKEILHRSLGSQAYPALARTVYLLTKSPPPIGNGQSELGNPPPTHLLIPIKNNLAPLTHALAFSINPDATLAWHPTPITNHPLLASPSTPQSSALSPQSSPVAASQLEFACDFLQKTLENGPIPSKTLLKEARSIGISHRTWLRARFQLDIQCHRDPATLRWLSYLPTHHPATPDFSI